MSTIAEISTPLTSNPEAEILVPPPHEDLLALAPFITAPPPILLLDPTLHTRITAHFHTLTKHPLTNRYSFLSLYQFLYPTYSDWSFPPPFQPIVREYLTFYFDTAVPYFLSLLGETEFIALVDREESPMVELFDVLASVGAAEDLGSAAVLGGRWKGGLLRAGQVELVVRVMGALLVQLRALMEVSKEGVGSGGKRDESVVRWTMEEFGRLCGRCKGMLRGFFAHSDFRSEGMEGRILRYLESEEVNVEMVRALDGKQREREKAKCEERKGKGTEA